jgi:hypothetical protein
MKPTKKKISKAKKKKKSDRTLNMSLSRLGDLLDMAYNGTAPAAILAREYPEEEENGSPPERQEERVETALVPRPLRRPQNQVNTKKFIFNTVWRLVTRLHEEQPNHPMFGYEREKNVVR